MSGVSGHPIFLGWNKNVQIFIQREFQTIQTTIQTIIQKMSENGSKKYPENSDKSVLNYRYLIFLDISIRFLRWCHPC